MQIYNLAVSCGKRRTGYSRESERKEKNNDDITIPPNFKILIIDDDLDFLKALAYTLSKKKIEFVTADSGYTAIETLKDTHFDLILLDLKMPGMNGAETFQRIKNIKKRPFVIIMTAYSDDDQVEIVKKLKPYGFLEKPFDLKEDLIPLIKKRIKEARDEN